MSEPPLISVVIPCFNAERTLLRTLASVRAQTYRPIEIIVVDDASRDGTLKLLRKQEADGVRVIAQPRNGGAPAARNAAIAVARGEFSLSSTPTTNGSRQARPAIPAHRAIIPP